MYVQFHYLQRNTAHKHQYNNQTQLKKQQEICKFNQ
jgi:hypothetical protein